MACNICGEEYRGLAGDCDCTSYSDGTPRPKFAFWRRLATAMPETTPAQKIRQAQLERMKLDNRCNLCLAPIPYPLVRHTLCDEKEQRRLAEVAIEYKKLADQYVQEYQVSWDLEASAPDLDPGERRPVRRRLKPKETFMPGPFKRYAFGEDV